MSDSQQEVVSPAALVVAVVPQGKGTEIINVAKEAHVFGGMIIFGQGTASQEIWERLGITKEREIVLFATLYSRVDAVMKLLTERFDMKKAGGGIIFALPIDKFLGKDLTKRLLQKAQGTGCITDLDTKKTEEIKEKVEKMIHQAMEEKNKAQKACGMDFLIVRMANGYAQEIMDTARKEGVSGGTILHGRTSLDSSAVKFFNITIEPESDLLFMLVPKEITDHVLEAILKKWGPHTAAHALGFVLPVLKVSI